MRLFVTGGAGFIGTSFIRLLISETDHEVVNFDLLTYAGKRSNLSEFEGGNRYEFVRGDIADPAAVEAVLAAGRFDAIVNFAAESHVDRSIHDASEFIRTNIQGTQTLIDAARRHKTGRFVQISTDEVYGDLSLEDPAFTEETPFKPSSPYSASKASSDMLVFAAHRTWGLPAVVTRCSNNYGPYQFPEKLIPLVISRAVGGEPVPVYGSGKNVRDWIYVEDHCRGVLAALIHGRVGEAYNFGGGCELENIKVVRSILAQLGRSEELIKHVTDRPGHDRRYAMNHLKASAELGWSPRVSFEEGLKKTIAWYASNPEWLGASISGEYVEFFKKHYGKI